MEFERWLQRGCLERTTGAVPGITAEVVALALFGTRFLTQIVLPGTGGPFCGFVTLGIPRLRGYTVCTIYQIFRSMFTGQVSRFGGTRGDYITYSFLMRIARRNGANLEGPLAYSFVKKQGIELKVIAGQDQLCNPRLRYARCSIGPRIRVLEEARERV